MQVQIYLNQSDTHPTADAISCCYATGQLSPYIQMAQDDALSQAFFELGFTATAKSRKRRPKAAQQPAESSRQQIHREEAPAPQEQTTAEKTEPPVQEDSTHKVIQMKEPQEEAEPVLPKFSVDMSVDEIYSRISAEEAEKVLIPTGNYKGKMLGEVIKQVPGLLAYYITISGTGDNLFHAAVKKLYEAQEQLKNLAS